MKKQEKPECPHVCAFCEHACRTESEEEMRCPYKGTVKSDHVCRRFRYDLLKRQPRLRAPLPTFCAEPIDF